MGKGGKYLNKGGAKPMKNNMASQQRMPAPQNQKPVKKEKKPMKKGKKIALTIGIIFLVLILVAVIGGVIYWNYLLGLMTRPEDAPVPEATTSDIDQMLAELTAPTDALETEPTGTTSPEETWPEIVSDENITNIMLVGQSSRPGEDSLIADTMILCSINRETKTLTLTSLMRDLRLVWPKYVDTKGKTHSGNNRINMAYNMGYHWTQNKQDSMDLMEAIVQHNFGVPVERTIEIDFDIFMKVVDLLGGVTVDISEEEYAYLKDNAKWLDEEGVHVGVNKLNGYHALCYARIRKVGHGDYERTERQREVITSLLNNLKDMNILKIHKLFTEIMPLITTDMSNQEITNYAFEFIPMLKDLKIQSQRIPYDGNQGYTQVEIDGTIDNQLTIPDIAAAAKWLQQSIGMEVAETD